MITPISTCFFVNRILVILITKYKKKIIAELWNEVAMSQIVMAMIQDLTLLFNPSSNTIYDNRHNDAARYCLNPDIAMLNEPIVTNIKVEK